MSDWTDEEYFSMLGLIPSGKLPQNENGNNNSKKQ